MKQINIFKGRVFALLAVVAIFCGEARAQLSGTYTIGGVSPDYTTLSAAINDLNGNGVNGPVQFLIRDGSYSGSSWMGSINNISGASSTNTITFRSQSGNKANVTISGSSSSNYIFRFNNARYITVKDLTLKKTSSSYCRVFDFVGQSSYNKVENCVLQAPATTSSSNARSIVFADSHTGTDNTVTGCDFINGGTWAYIRGTGTTTTTNNFVFSNNTFTSTSSTYYGIYAYYTNGLKFINNEFTRTGSGYFYLFYSYYANGNFEVMGNSANISTSASYLYAFYCYYTNYINTSTTETPKIHNNNIVMNNTTSYTEPFYSPYFYNGTILNNTISATVTSGYIYMYGPIYYGKDCRVESNTFNFKTTSSGYIYTTYFCYNSSNYNDTVKGNTFNFDGRYIYNYCGHYGKSLITENTYNLSTTTGTIYNYLNYSNGLEYSYNKVKATSTSGTIYGLYENGSSSYAGGKIHHNDFEISSSTGTVYGLYPYYSNSDYYNNVITTKTSGANYTLRVYYNYDSKIKNNTFYSMATGSTNYTAYIYNTSSSYKTELKNNIFSKSSTSGYGIYAYNKAYFTADYNLYYVPGGTLFYSNSPSYSGNSLQTWRGTTGSDMNSLVYQPPFVNASARDLRINASSPAAWAVNGRGEHDTTIKDDMANTARPILVTAGVPDLGAYEVTPTSTPPNAVATPASPVANSTQVFTFGQDTVASIEWGASVPASYTVRQYTGVQAAPMPPGTGRMYFYIAGTPSTWVHGHKPNIYYKDPWVGDIQGGENDAVSARSSNNGAWEGYNYSNSQIDKARNIVKPTYTLDSVGSYTAVQNGRIGIRCVEDPKGVTITNVTAFTADIDWLPIFNPVGYQVLLKKDKKVPSAAEWAAASFPTTNSLAAGGLDEDTKYYIFIRSICGAKDTSGYTLDSFTTLITCHTPVITIGNVNGTRAVISWTNVKTAHKYEYAMSKSETPPSFGTDINKTSMLAPFLDEGQEYYVHVRAHCSSMYEKSDWATAKFNTWATGVANMNGGANGLQVVPNPVHDNMVVTIGGTVTKGTLTVTDMTGKILKVQDVLNNTATVNVSELPAGIYIVQYADEGRREQMKFTKQ